MTGDYERAFWTKLGLALPGDFFCIFLLYKDVTLKNRTDFHKPNVKKGQRGALSSSVSGLLLKQSLRETNMEALTKA